MDAAGWTPPTSGRELLRAGLVGTGGGTPVLALVVSDDVDPRRVVVFVLLGDLLCTFRPSGVERDALEVALPFRIGNQRALVVVVECESEAEAEELERLYAADRESLEAAEPESPRSGGAPSGIRRAAVRSRTRSRTTIAARDALGHPAAAATTLAPVPRAGPGALDPRAIDSGARRDGTRRRRRGGASRAAHHARPPARRDARAGPGGHAVPGAVRTVAAADRSHAGGRARRHRGPHRRHARGHRDDRAAWLPPGPRCAADDRAHAPRRRRRGGVARVRAHGPAAGTRRGVAHRAAGRRPAARDPAAPGGHHRGRGAPRRCAAFGRRRRSHGPTPSSWRCRPFESTRRSSATTPPCSSARASAAKTRRTRCPFPTSSASSPTCTTTSPGCASSSPTSTTRRSAARRRSGDSPRSVVPSPGRCCRRTCSTSSGATATSWTACSCRPPARSTCRGRSCTWFRRRSGTTTASCGSSAEAG